MKHAIRFSNVDDARAVAKIILRSPDSTGYVAIRIPQGITIDDDPVFGPVDFVFISGDWIVNVDGEEYGIWETRVSIPEYLDVCTLIFELRD